MHTEIVCYLQQFSVSGHNYLSSVIFSYIYILYETTIKKNCEVISYPISVKYSSFR